MRCHYDTTRLLVLLADPMDSERLIVLLAASQSQGEAVGTVELGSTSAPETLATKRSAWLTVRFARSLRYGLAARCPRRRWR
jgi:hypothetical protein